MSELWKSEGYDDMRDERDQLTAEVARLRNRLKLIRLNVSGFLREDIDATPAIQEVTRIVIEQIDASLSPDDDVCTCGARERRDELHRETRRAQRCIDEAKMRIAAPETENARLKGCCNDCSRALVTESMHHENALKRRLLDVANKLNTIANPDWVKP